MVTWSAPARSLAMPSASKAEGVRNMVETVFLAVVFAIMWLSGSLFAEDIQAWHAAERRRHYCPVRVR